MDVLEDVEEAQLMRRRISVDDYHRMAEVGLLPPDAKVELIEGEIFDMAPTGSRHYWAVVSLNRALQHAVGDAAIVAIQAPLHLDSLNEPEPDLAVLKPGLPLTALPTGADCLLVIEVADTTLPYDVRIKTPLYARHGVPEVWVLDLSGGMLRRFTALQDGVYSEASATRQPGIVALPGLPGCSIDFTGLL